MAWRVARESRRLGLFLLIHRASWEFLSGSTGKRVAIWIKRTGQILDAASNRVGRTRSAFGALDVAVQLDRASRGVVGSHRRPRGGPRRPGPPDGPPGRADRG
jgi:hypothetical protein